MNAQALVQHKGGHLTRIFSSLRYFHTEYLIVCVCVKKESQTCGSLSFECMQTRRDTHAQLKRTGTFDSVAEFIPTQPNG